jgi:hypothetical protein
MSNQQKKQRKYDRCRKSGQNARYKSERRHEKSHVRRLSAHIKRYGVRDEAACATFTVARWQHWA